MHQATAADGNHQGHLMHRRADDQRPHPPDHPLARSFVQEISAPFGDLNKKGSLTRVLRTIADAQLDHQASVLLCLVRAYTVARDTRNVRPEHWDPGTGRANRMPLFCAMFERFVQACAKASRWEYTWQQMEDDIEADDRLVLWWSEHRALGSETPDHPPHEQEGGQNRCAALPPGVGPERELRAVDTQARHQRRTQRSQTEEEREERAALAHKVLAHLLSRAVPIQEPIILWEHLACGCPLYHTRAGKEVCARCFPDPLWSEEVLALIRSIVEAQASVGPAKETTAGAHEHMPGGLPNASEDDQHSSPETAGWTEREEAHAHGVRLLQALMMNNYRADVRVRFTSERHQVVLVGEGCELVCVLPEHIEYVIAQAQNGTL